MTPAAAEFVRVLEQAGERAEAFRLVLAAMQQGRNDFRDTWRFQ